MSIWKYHPSLCLRWWQICRGLGQSICLPTAFVLWSNGDHSNSQSWSQCAAISQTFLFLLSYVCWKPGKTPSRHGNKEVSSIAWANAFWQRYMESGYVRHTTKDETHQTMRSSWGWCYYKCLRNVLAWFVGKTLVFLANQEMVDTLDKIREEKLYVYVIKVQSIMKCVRDKQKYKFYRKCIYKMQAGAKAWAVRRWYPSMHGIALEMSGLIGIPFSI